jgi:hypothetical protein
VPNPINYSSILKDSGARSPASPFAIANGLAWTGIAPIFAEASFTHQLTRAFRDVGS